MKTEQIINKDVVRKRICAIASSVAYSNHITIKELIQRDRHEYYTIPRMQVYKISRENITGATYKIIGEVVGERSHGAVMSAIKRFNNLLDTEPGLLEKFEVVKFKALNNSKSNFSIRIRMKIISILMKLIKAI